MNRPTIGASCLLLALVVLGPATSAGAHATLVDTTPGDGDLLDRSPEMVRVTFDEAVELAPAAIRVFDSAGNRVDGGDAGYGVTQSEAVVSLPAEMADGWYVATWRAVSLDGHPVRGAFTYQVGEGRPGLDDTFVGALLGEGQGWWGGAGTIVRWLSYAATLVAAGAGLAILLWGAPGSRVGRLVRVAGSVGIGASVAQIPLLAAEATGLGWGALVSGSALGDALSSPVGRAAITRIAGLAVVTTAVARSRRWAMPVGVAAIVAAEIVSGHTLTTDPRWLVMVADAAHVMAAAVWIGGLAALVAILAGTGRDLDEPSAADMVARFSVVAVGAVVALAAAGAALAWTQVRTPSALTSTVYGWTLVSKTALALTVIGIGAYNNRVLVPALRTEESRGGVMERLGRTIRVELAVLAVVLGATAVLVNTQPAAEAAGVVGPYSVYLPFGDGQVNLVVDPNHTGLNEIHAYVLSADGTPETATGEAALELTFPADQIGPLTRTPSVAGPGHWVHTGSELSIAGSWDITFHLLSGFDERVATATVDVHGGDHMGYP